MLNVQGSSRLDNGQHRTNQTIEEIGREWASAPGEVRVREGAGEGETGPGVERGCQEAALAGQSSSLSVRALAVLDFRRASCAVQGSIAKVTRARGARAFIRRIVSAQSSF